MKQIWMMIMGILMFLSGLSQTVREKLSEVSTYGLKIHMTYDGGEKLVEIEQNTDLNVFFKYAKSELVLTEKAIVEGKPEEYQYTLTLNDKGCFVKGKEPEGDVFLEYDGENRLSKVTRGKEVSVLFYKNGNLDHITSGTVLISFSYNMEVNQPAIFIKDTPMLRLFSYWSLSSFGYFGKLSGNLVDSITITEQKEPMGEKQIQTVKLIYKKDLKGNIISLKFKSDNEDLNYGFKYK